MAAIPQIMALAGKILLPTPRPPTPLAMPGVRLHFPHDAVLRSVKDPLRLGERGGGGSAWIQAKGPRLPRDEYRIEAPEGNSAPKPVQLSGDSHDRRVVRIILGHRENENRVRPQFVDDLEGVTRRSNLLASLARQYSQHATYRNNADPLQVTQFAGHQIGD